jgi:hypothetical protein
VVAHTDTLSFLDKNEPFGYVLAVIRPSAMQSTATKRILSATTLLFFVFLPLHFHAASGARVTQECACLQGTRTQLGPVASPPAYFPIIDAQPLVLQSIVPRHTELHSLQNVRAPPATLSV